MVKLELIHDSHIYGHTIMRPEFPGEYAEIEATLRATELPLRPAGPYATGRGAAPKRQKRGTGASAHRVLLPADLKQSNLDLDAAFKEQQGWKSQPVASEGVFSKSGKRSKGDFAKNRVFDEVEFGNTASLFRDPEGMDCDQELNAYLSRRRGVRRAGTATKAMRSFEWRWPGPHNRSYQHWFDRPR